MKTIKKTIDVIKMKKIKIALILATLMVLLIGAVSATDVSDDTQSSDTAENIISDTPDVEKEVVQQTSTPITDAKEKVEEQKDNQVFKEEKNIKTEPFKRNVTSEMELRMATVVSLAPDGLIIDIQSDIKLTLGNISIISTMKEVTINGNGYTLNGNNKFFLTSNDSSKVIVNNLNIINCNSSEGGAIINGGNLTLNNCTLENNHADNNGGAILNVGTLTLNNCILENNYADKMGGAIYNQGTSTIKNTKFTNNNATNGAALYISSGSPVIEDNYFIANKAQSTGNAIKDSSFGLSTIADNINDKTSKYAGTIHVMFLAKATIKHNTFYDELNTSISISTNNSNPTVKDKIKITFQLKDQLGYSLAKQTLNINIKDKQYSMTTDKDGLSSIEYTLESNETQVTAAYNGNSIYLANNTTLLINAQKIGTILSIKLSNATPINNTPINITVTLTDAKGKKLANMNIKLNINGKNYTLKTNANGQVTQDYTPTKVEIQTVTASYDGNSQYEKNDGDIKITVKDKINTKTTTSTVTGVIGEKLTLKATVKDNSNNKVNEGNLIFKLNGITIKDNGKLTGSSNPLKVKVVNGVATATVTPDLTMRNANKLTASYIGTTIYNASVSDIAKTQISQRNASIEVSSNVKTIKQGQVLTLIAKVYDTTNNKKSTKLVEFADEFVYFKVNGITLKDANGNMLKVKVINGVASTNYTIPLGLSGVTDGKTMTPKNHTILAGFYNKNYQENIRNTSTFIVERSNITITISNATVYNKTHALSLTATIKDYLGNVVAGPNKCVVKINGLSLKNGNQPLYFYSNNGILELKDITIPAYNNYKTIEIVTQDRLAYKSQRNMTTTIKVLN